MYARGLNNGVRIVRYRGMPIMVVGGLASDLHLLLQWRTGLHHI